MARDGINRGKHGEETARRYLRDRGYFIVARNWRCRFGEIDLIARDGDTLAFIEVKTRTGTGFGGAEGAVTPWKRARLIAAARCYLGATETELAARFDVVTITSGQIRLYKDAFQVE